MSLAPRRHQDTNRSIERPECPVLALARHASIMAFSLNVTLGNKEDHRSGAVITLSIDFCADLWDKSSGARLTRPGLPGHGSPLLRGAPRIVKGAECLSSPERPRVAPHRPRHAQRRMTGPHSGE